MKKIKILEQKLDNLENTIRFLLKHDKDEVVVKSFDNFITWEYLLDCKVVKIYEPNYYWEPIIVEYKRFDENQIMYKVITGTIDTYFLLDKAREEVIKVQNFAEEKPKAKRARRVRDENKTEKKTRRTKTTKRNKL